MLYWFSTLPGCSEFMSWLSTEISKNPILWGPECVLELWQRQTHFQRTTPSFFTPCIRASHNFFPMLMLLMHTLCTPRHPKDAAASANSMWARNFEKELHISEVQSFPESYPLPQRELQLHTVWSFVMNPYWLNMIKHLSYQNSTFLINSHMLMRVFNVNICLTAVIWKMCRVDPCNLVEAVWVPGF